MSPTTAHIEQIEQPGRCSLPTDARLQNGVPPVRPGGEQGAADHCPACSRQIHQNKVLVGLGVVRAGHERLKVVDPTWRHSTDGTVAVLGDSTVVCGSRP